MEGDIQRRLPRISRWAYGMHPPENLSADILRKMCKKPHKTFDEITARDQDIEGNVSP
jgi:hypothetical protein